jgi:hypothetical protein
MISYRTAEALPMPPQEETSKFNSTLTGWQLIKSLAVKARKGWINMAYDYDAVKIAKAALADAGLR